MKIIVFGGSGFLGSHVSDELSNAGHNVVIFDRIESPWLRDDQEMIFGDILDHELVINSLEDIDIVYNFSAIADLDESLNNPIDTVKINILGNALLLDACKKANVSRYILASTIYVSSREGGFYRCSKQASESYVEEFQRTFDLDFTILRYGSLYGPRSNYKNGIWRILKNAIDKNEIVYEGSPEAIREYIHVYDAAHASVSILNKKFINQHVILTGHQPTKVDDLLKMIAEMMNIPNTNTKFVNPTHLGHYIRTPYSVQAEIAKKFIPDQHVDLGHGLLQLIEFIKSEE